MNHTRSRSRAWLAILAEPLALAWVGTWGGACGGAESPGDEFGFEVMGTGQSTMPTSVGDTAGDDGDDGSGSTGTGGSGGSDAADDSATGDDTGPAPTGEHALATIVVGETHPVEMPSAATGILSASFIPDASAAAGAAACGMDVQGCTVVLPPMCPAACLVGETCVYDDACSPVCQAPCDAACAADEVCYFPFPGTAACHEVEAFDGGRLDFFGTTVPISLYPPYQLPMPPDGPVTQPDKMLTVKGSGATAAGFAPFEAMVTTTASVFSDLDEILPTEAFGVGDLAITWVPGMDDLTISLTVTGTLGTVGTVTCEADDTVGSFAVPRAAIDMSIATDTANTISVSMQRSHVETTMGLETQGALLDAMVQPEGWVDFTFVSIETGTLTNM